MKSLANAAIEDIGELGASPSTLEEKAEFILGLINGKGRARLILLLQKNGAMRFNEIQRSLDCISPSLLTSHLSVFTDNKIVLRKQYLSIPPKVTYSLTRRGIKLSNFIAHSTIVFDNPRMDSRVSKN